MSFIRNRRTGENFITSDSNKLVKIGLFSPDFDETHLEISEMTQQVNSLFPETISDKEKLAANQSLQQIFHEHKEVIQQLIKESRQAAVQPGDESFLEFMSNLLISSKLNSVLPLAAVFSSLITPVAADAGIQIHAGQPAGGLDLCASVLFGCVQGYLTNGTQSWDQSMPQFNRIVQQASTGDAPIDVREQLRKCMDSETVGTLVSNAYQKASGTVKTTCTAQSTQWQGWQLNSEAINMPSDACQNFQNTFLASSQNCMSWTGRAKQLGIILGGVAGGIAALVVIGCAVQYCKKRFNENNNLNRGSANGYGTLSLIV